MASRIPLLIQEGCVVLSNGSKLVATHVSSSADEKLQASGACTLEGVFAFTAQAMQVQNITQHVTVFLVHTYHLTPSPVASTAYGFEPSRQKEPMCSENHTGVLREHTLVSSAAVPTLFQAIA